MGMGWWVRWWGEAGDGGGQLASLSMTALWGKCRWIAEYLLYIRCAFTKHAKLGSSGLIREKG